MLVLRQQRHAVGLDRQRRQRGRRDDRALAHAHVDDARRGAVLGGVEIIARRQDGAAREPPAALEEASTVRDETRDAAGRALDGDRIVRLVDRRFELEATDRDAVEPHRIGRGDGAAARRRETVLRRRLRRGRVGRRERGRAAGQHGRGQQCTRRDLAAAFPPVGRLRLVRPRHRGHACCSTLQPAGRSCGPPSMLASLH